MPQMTAYNRPRVADRRRLMLIIVQGCLQGTKFQEAEAKCY